MRKISKSLLLSKFCIYAAALSNILDISAMSGPKTQLEKIYLLNVALFMPERDLVKLAMVNKKSQETLLMMHRTTINDRGIDTRRTVAQRRELLELQALSFKDLGRPIETLDFRGDLEHCLYIASLAKDIDTKKISAVALYGKGCEIWRTRNLLEALKSYGFTNVKNIEMHDVLGEHLYSMLYNRDTFNKQPIVTCDDIDVNSLVRILDDSHAYIGSSDVRVHIKSVDLTNTNDRQDEILQRIFKDAGFYIDEVEYHEDLNDEDADYVRNTIRVIDEDSWDWKKISELTSMQYEKRLRPAVYIDSQDGFDKISPENLRGLIGQDEHETITLIKWSGSLNPIADHAISWKALIDGNYDCYDDDKYAVDITGLQPGATKARVITYNADSLIISNDGKRYAIYGTYIPGFATPYQSFWDQFFDYSGSEIVISDDVGRDDLKMIPSNIDGRITFFGNRDDKEQSEIRHRFAKTRESYMNRDVIDAQGINARDKINEEDLYYAKVDINFPRQTVPHHAIGQKPTFRYLLTRDEMTSQHATLQLICVFDEVYDAKNKRLVIHPEIQHINFQPRVEGRLTFVLSPNIRSINEEFWQPGNSYLLSTWQTWDVYSASAFDNNTTLDYLESIKEQHGIDISDRPDDFGFWNISKKSVFQTN